MSIRLKQLLFGATGLLVLHALVMTLAPDQTAQAKAQKILYSNIIQAVAAAMAAYYCWRAFRTHEGFAKRFWAVTGLVPLLWLFSQVIWTAGESRPDLVFFSQNATLFLFFFSFAPFIYLILIRPEEEPLAVDWSHVLDIFQVIVVLICIFLWQFYLPALPSMSPPSKVSIRA